MKALSTLTTTAFAFVTLPSNHDLLGKKGGSGNIIGSKEHRIQKIAESMEWTIRNKITDKLNTQIIKVIQSYQRQQEIYGYSGV